MLDPVFALRRRVTVAPGASVRIAFWTLAAGSRRALLDQIDKHRDAAAYGRATTLAWTQAQVQQHHLGMRPGEAALFQRLASHVVFASPALRPSSDTIRQGAGPQSGLWSLGISGDLPIVLLRIGEIESIGVAKQMLHAHEYWLMKQLAVDLVILNERRSSYVQDLQIALETLVRASQARPTPGVKRRRGRAYVLRGDLIEASMRSLLISSARVVIAAQHGSLSQQLDRAIDLRPPIRPFAKSSVARLKPAALPTTPELEFFNGLGGFGSGGREYVTILGPGQSTPAPWINVIANAAFGFQVATEGGGYTWSGNSRENQLTPWSNDPVADPQGEAFYLRDQDTGEVWSPTALPIRDVQASYVARHGRGHQPLRAHGERRRGRPRPVRPLRGINQDLSPQAHQQIGTRSRNRRDRLCRMGPGRFAILLARLRRNRAGSADRRALRAQPLEYGLRFARRLRRYARRADRLDRRPARIHRPQREFGEPGGAC